MCPEGFRGTSAIIAASLAPSPGGRVRLGGGVECRGAQLTIVAVDVCTPYSLLDFF